MSPTRTRNAEVKGFMSANVTVFRTMTEKERGL